MFQNFRRDFPSFWRQNISNPNKNSTICKPCAPVKVGKHLLTWDFSSILESNILTSKVVIELCRQQTQIIITFVQPVGVFLNNRVTVIFRELNYLIHEIRDYWIQWKYNWLKLPRSQWSSHSLKMYKGSSLFRVFPQINYIPNLLDAYKGWAHFRKALQTLMYQPINILIIIKRIASNNTNMTFYLKWKKMLTY